MAAMTKAYWHAESSQRERSIGSKVEASTGKTTHTKIPICPYCRTFTNNSMRTRIKAITLQEITGHRLIGLNIIVMTDGRRDRHIVRQKNEQQQTFAVLSRSRRQKIAAFDALKLKKV